MSWSGGLAEWVEGDTTFLSVAFTWKLNDAYSRALFAKAQGMKVVAGGPALFLIKMQHKLTEVADIGTDYPEAVTKHNPLATFASRGCPVGCARYCATTTYLACQLIIRITLLNDIRRLTYP